jgi:hypothetical protein
MCVFKYHAFIFLERPPPWYGTVTTRYSLTFSRKRMKTLFTLLNFKCLTFSSANFWEANNGFPSTPFTFELMMPSYAGDIQYICGSVHISPPRRPGGLQKGLHQNYGNSSGCIIAYWKCACSRPIYLRTALLHNPLHTFTKPIAMT